MNYEDINYNEVLISGIINNVYDKNKYIIFGLTCDNYSRDKNNKCYISLRIYEDLYYKYKDLFIKDNKVFVKGYLNSYSDKNKNIFDYVMVTDISDNPDDILKGRKGPYIRYDSDGVEVWNGKRIEKISPTKEEREEIENLLKEYK